MERYEGYFDERVLEAFNKLVKYLETRYCMELKYDHIKNPTEKYDNDICYEFWKDYHEMGYVYYRRSRSSGLETYASFEPNLIYLGNAVERIGFYKEVRRKRWPQLKLFFNDFDKIKNSVKKMCDTMDESIG